MARNVLTYVLRFFPRRRPEKKKSSNFCELERPLLICILISIILRSLESLRWDAFRRKNYAIELLSNPPIEESINEFIMATFDKKHPPKLQRTPPKHFNSQKGKDPTLSLLREVIKNGFIKDLSRENQSEEFLKKIEELVFSDKNSSSLNPKNIPLLSCVVDKIESEKHVAMGKPLETHHMAGN